MIKFDDSVSEFKRHLRALMPELQEGNSGVPKEPKLGTRHSER